MAKLIALTGATGFVGRVVLQNLLENGYHIKALVRPGSLAKTFQHPDINWIEGELGNPQSEKVLCAGADIVIHMAGLVTARTKGEYYKVNADAVGSLAKSARALKVKRFIYLSSLAAKKPKLSNYAGSKRAGEGAMARRLGGVKAVVVRAPAVFGAGDKATAPFYALIKKGWLPAPGGRGWRKRKLGLIYVNDLANFITGDCLEGACDGRTVSPATQASITWPEFARECGQAQVKSVKIVPLPLSVLYPFAAINSVTKRLFGKGHLTLGKLREFLHEDWSTSEEFVAETPLQLALKKTILDG
ncbi:MAG: hypothetical protein COA91_11385 [Robiginitomaculum sp.]|nr:MAG: hypothetical protein COA91_11385 [Robiginitomaculum sp.]